jgi:APA family basic amino acid/polyamine antiporter
LPLMTKPKAQASLTRILGLGFGVAVIFGGTVGAGILRLPGVIAGPLGSAKLILLVWALGGIYSILGAISVSELGAAMPQAGGFYVYARHAYGPAAGFCIGWSDWLNNCAAIAFVSLTAAEYLLALSPPNTGHMPHLQSAIALGLICLVCLLHWFGLRLGSTAQKVTSSLTALTFLALVVACFLHSPAGVLPAAAPIQAAPIQATTLTSAQSPAHGFSIFAMLVPVFVVLPAIAMAYDGWYEAIYFTEEDTNPAKHLPRAMIGGVVLVTGLYLLMNLAFLHVLTIPQLAKSNLAAADAARIVFPAWSSIPDASGTFVTVLSLMTLLSFLNASLLGAPRILFAVGRDGLFSGAATVGKGGTPRVALLVTAATAAGFALSGRIEDILGVAAILIAVEYCVNYSAVFVLRWREPQLPRPFRAWGYPWTTALVLLGSLVFLVGDVRQDWTSASRAAVLLALALPVYWWRGRNAPAHIS